jgi:predicted MPP superfamily phosphohydrolase
MMDDKTPACNPPSRRKPLLRNRSVTRGVLLALLILALIAGDALFVEPYWIQTTHYTLQEPVSATLKIAQLSDIHTDGIGRRERHVLKLLDAEKPDIIVITGDTVIPERGTYKAAHAFYQQLHAPLGVWFVRGNWENTIPIRRERAFYSSAGVHLLVNASVNPRADIWLAGMDDAPSGHADFEMAMKHVPAGAFVIALFHSPAFFHRIASRVNLALAGHTHGGQVHIPFVRPFWLPAGCDGFLAGWYQENGARLYVTRGVGMSFAPVRFLCRPEVDLITLTPAPASPPASSPGPSSTSDTSVAPPAP